MQHKGSHETSRDALDLLICTALRQEGGTSSTRIWRRIERRVRNLMTLQNADQLLLLEGEAKLSLWLGSRDRLLVDDILYIRRV